VRRILLFRHAKSSWKDTSLDDIDRPLAGRGRKATKAMGRYVADHDLRPAIILCSTAARTRETLERSGKALARNVPTRFEDGLYHAGPTALLDRLRRLDDTLPSAMLIGHNPGLEELASALAGNGDAGPLASMNEKFPTGALAVFDADVEAWKDLRPGCARLERFVRPRDLVAV